MNDGRRRRIAKQRQRNSQRDNTRRRKDRADNPLDQAVRKGLGKHPLFLLAMASYLIDVATPDRLASGKRDTLPLENLVTGLAGRRCRETTVLLAVLAELLVDDDVLRDRCRQEVKTRNDRLPKWLVEPDNVQPYRVLRERHVLGDGDDWVIGAKLAGGSEITIATYVDHNMLSAVTRIAVHMHPIDKVIADPRLHLESNTTRVEGSLADARAWITKGLERADIWPGEDSWKECRPLLTWLAAHLPEGGATIGPTDLDDDAMADLVDSFFTSSMGAPFRDTDYRELLMEFCDTGSGDPLRWSVTRITDVLQSLSYDDHVPLDVAVDGPALLRAFVPFAHARSEVRQDLTDDAITTIDQLSRRCKRRLMDDARRVWAEDDDIEPPPWLTRPDRAS